MEAPFLPPVSACLFWCPIFAVCPNRASVKTIAHAGAADGDRGRTRARAPPGIPTAFWRSVGPSHNVFVTESFIDELAAAAKQDPLAYRLALLDKAPRAKAVLALAAEKAGWERPLPERVRPRRLPAVRFRHLYCARCRSRGLEGWRGACPARRLRGRLGHGRQSRYRPCADPERDHLRHHCGASRQDHAEGRPCGASQLRHLPNAAHGRGARHRGPHRSESEPPGGMGEAGTSCIPAAVTNAIFAATGKRLRQLPIDAAALKQPT